jgi:hypothetical protein
MWNLKAQKLPNLLLGSHNRDKTVTLFVYVIVYHHLFYREISYIVYIRIVIIFISKFCLYCGLQLSLKFPHSLLSWAQNPPEYFIRESFNFRSSYSYGFHRPVEFKLSNQRSTHSINLHKGYILNFIQI